MPEGDTIRDTASMLQDALVPDVVELVAVRGARRTPPLGSRIEHVTPRGKHLLVGFSDGSTLHTHLGMHGSWRIAAPTPVPAVVAGPPGHGVTAVVATARAAAVCRSASTAELLDGAGLRRHPVLRALGPDLCDADPDLDEIVRRVRRLAPDLPVAIALLDQRVAAGIGNVYRSEALWAEAIAPTAAVAALGDDDLRRLYARAHEQLRTNIGRGRRRTVPGGLAVYDRAGRRCRRDDGTVTVDRLGEHARTVWWCPSCQTAP